MDTTAACPNFPEVAPQKVSALRSEVIRSFTTLERLSHQWQLLWADDPVGEIFQTLPWNRAWWEGYGADLELHCIVLWRGDSVVGLLPLVRRDRTLRFLGAPQADYGDILAREADTPAVLAAALESLFTSGDSKECVLEHLSADSRLVRNLDKVPAKLRRNLRLVAAGHAPTILIDSQPGLLATLAAKKHLRRHETKLAKSAALNFRFLSSRDEIRQHLPAFFQHQIRRRILHGQESSCLQPEFSNFLRAAVEELDPRRHLRFGVLQWGDQPLAYHIGFLVNGKFTMYQQAFDVDAWDYSPGEVLLRHLFLYADQNVRREFDFSVGEEPYKARFANHFKPIFTLYAQPQGIEGHLRHAYRSLDGAVGQLRKALKASMRSNPEVFLRAKQARRWIGEVRAQMRNQALQFKPSSRQAATAFQAVRTDHNSEILETKANIQLMKARLSDLADLYRESPTFHLASRLTEYRERLRKGDTLFIMRMQGKPVLIAWMAGNPRNGFEDKSKPGSQALYECSFLSHGNKAAYKALLTYLAAEKKLAA